MHLFVAKSQGRDLLSFNHNIFSPKRESMFWWKRSDPYSNTQRHYKSLIENSCSDYKKKVAKIIMKPYVSEYFLHFLTKITIDRSRTRFSWKWNIMVFLGKCWPIYVYKYLCRVCNWWIALAIFRFSPCI
jgi:hypothetical protein